MIEVVLPVAPFSKKIIETELGRDPIRLAPSHMMYAMFQINRINPSNRSREASERLTTKATFLVNNKLAKRMVKNAADIGLTLYAWHMEQMCFFVYSRKEETGELNVKAAIESFYLRNRLTEDDFQLESAYKRVQRYFWKKEAQNAVFCLTKQPRSVRLNASQKVGRLQGLIFLNANQIIQIHNAFFLRFINTKHNVPENYCDFFPQWLDYYYRGMKMQEIADAKRISRQAVSERIAKFSRELQFDDAFREMTEQVLRENLPNPSEKVLPAAVG